MKRGAQIGYRYIIDARRFDLEIAAFEYFEQSEDSGAQPLVAGAKLRIAAKEYGKAMRAAGKHP